MFETNVRELTGVTGRPSTVGETLARMETLTAMAIGGFALAVGGCVAPWATSPLGSVSGVTGSDGKAVVAVAVLGALLAWRRAHIGAAVCALIVVGLGVYENIHLHQALSGTGLAEVGWGVYVVIAGGGVTLVALSRRILT